jgi:hypothetical protein
MSTRDELHAACDAFFRSRNMPVQLTPLGMERPLADSTAPTHEPAMKANRQILHESRPPAGPKVWTRRVVTTPPPSMRTDWKQVVADARKAGLVIYPKKP